jgi:acetolactate synthase-1/2/3 large subunit
MNGAHALLATLRANGVTTCFANPGTSEMQFVAGLDEVPEISGVLCLFEGVATGAADGYARVSGTPAATLLHLGPGLANGWANLHNARRARTPLLNIVGDHATHHAQYDAPLQSNIDALTSGLEGWQRRTMSPHTIATDVADALSAAYGPPGQVATLIVPADVSWTELDRPPTSWPVATKPLLSSPDPHLLDHAVKLLRNSRTALLVGGTALDTEQLALAHRVGVATQSKVIMETFPAIVDRGAGVANPERLIYFSEFAQAQLANLDALILLGSRDPVSFFAYPNVASRLTGEECEVVSAAPPGSDTLTALLYLVDALGASSIPPVLGAPSELPTGVLNSQSMAAAIGATLPEGAIVADESNTSILHLWGATQFAVPHRWMTLTGGAIGMGLPLALGAAVASRRRVVALESDGSMMYTLQALWTMARESLDVTVVGFSNHSYAILNLELQRVGATKVGATSQQLLDLDNPTIDLCGLASAQGVPSVRVTTADELVHSLLRSYATPGPMFIEVMLPKGLS